MINPLQTFTDITAGSDCIAAIRSDGTLWTCGSNYYGQLGTGLAKFSDDNKLLNQVKSGSTWKKVLAVGHGFISLKTDGTIWGWGENNGGFIGDGTTKLRKKPVQTGVDNNWKDLFASRSQCMAIKNDGSVWTWGYNYACGNYDYILNPVKIDIPGNCINIALGQYFAFFFMDDGSLWVCGSDFGMEEKGKLTQPEKIFDQSPWKKIIPGYIASFAIKNDGTLWGWGYGSNYRLGNNSLDEQTSAILIDSDNQWMDISVADEHCLGLKTDGSIWSWGTNEFKIWDNESELNEIIKTRTKQVPGQEINIQKDTFFSVSVYDIKVINKIPIKIGTEHDWIKITAGRETNFALKSDGSFWGWGRNNDYQLGDGINRSQGWPKQIGLLISDAWKPGKASKEAPKSLKSKPGRKYSEMGIEMKDYIPAFKKMVEELQTIPGISIKKYEILPPATEEQLKAAGEKFTLTQDMLDFYRATNGITLQWDLEDKRFESIYGRIEIMPVETLFTDWESEIFYDFENELESLKGFDLCFNEGICVLHIDGSKNPEVCFKYLSEEQDLLDMDFKDYLNALLHSRGFFYWQSAVIDTLQKNEPCAETKDFLNIMPQLFPDFKLEEIIPNKNAKKKPKGK